MVLLSVALLPFRLAGLACALALQQFVFGFRDDHAKLRAWFKK